MRVNRKINDESRFNVDSIIKALVVPREEIEAGFEKDFELKKDEDVETTKLFSKNTLAVELKPKQLNKNLLSYLRAHCLLFYNGKDISKLRVTDPGDVDYELMILNAYEKVLNRFKELNPHRFDLEHQDDLDISATQPHRKMFIEQYRVEQCKIMANQYSLLNTMKMILSSVKLVTGTTYTYQIN